MDELWSFVDDKGNKQWVTTQAKSAEVKTEGDSWVIVGIRKYRN